MSTGQLLFAAFVLWLIRRWYRRRNSPPGPFSVPFIGSVSAFKEIGPRAFSSLKYAEQYGPIVRFDALNKSYFVFNDFAQVKELFGREIVSARPTNYFLRNIRGNGHRQPGIAYAEGQPWSSHRRFALKTLKDFGFGRNSLDDAIHEEANDLIADLIETNEADGEVRIQATFNVAVINVLWRLVASTRFDPKKEQTKELMAKLNSLFKGGEAIHIYTFFEFLRPYGPYVDSDKRHFDFKDMFRQYIRQHEAYYDPDAPPRDLIDHYLNEIRKGTDPNFDREQLVMLCVDLFQAGAETSSTTLVWAVLFMALHPKVQEKCQEEIEELLGQRLPLKEDMTKLNYVNATIMEIQRLSCIAPLPLPHRNTEDLHLEGGFVIPKNSPIFYNTKKFMHDPDVFQDPGAFKPERFLDSKGGIRKYEQFVPFGIGKRICMGDSLAKQELFIFFAMLLQRITIGVVKHRGAPDKDDYTMGITTMPKPFYVSMHKRY